MFTDKKCISDTKKEQKSRHFLAIKKAPQHCWGDFWPILIQVPGIFLMIFLDKQHQATLFLKENLFDTFPVVLVGNPTPPPQKKTYFFFA
jgi:hypothetical protein